MGSVGCFQNEPEEATVNALTGEAEKVGTIPSSEVPGNTERKPRREDESETACRDLIEKEKLDILKEIHDSPIGGHAGINCTYRK